LNRLNINSPDNAFLLDEKAKKQDNEV